MIVRIVKMTFREDKTEDFETFVKTVQDRIKNFNGCRHLDVLRDIREPNVFFTYSHWDSEKDLDNYRFSEFFKETWSTVRVWFKSKPAAWSTRKL